MTKHPDSFDEVFRAPLAAAEQRLNGEDAPSRVWAAWTVAELLLAAVLYPLGMRGTAAVSAEGEGT